MEDPRKHQVRELITSLLMSNKRHARYLRVVAVLALAVTVIVPMAVRQYGITKTVTQTVLDCHYVGNGAHVHDASCYDAAGNLICPLAERPLHTHTEDCYDADGNLVCGLEEATEEHIHGAACFTEVTVEQADAAAMPQRAFSEDITNEDDERLVKVDVVSPKGALPEDAEMKIALVNSDDVKDVVTQAVAEKTSGKLVGLRAVDISFVNSEGREVEPLEKVTVTLADNLIDTKEDCYLVHIDDNGKATVVDPLTTEELDKRKIADEKNEVVFDADSFSTYVVALTTQDKQLTASDDETYSITVNAPAEAGIPQNSELSVTEVVPGDEAYDAYFEQALAALGQDADAAALARFFDIKILNYGEEVQPQAAVRVDVRLVDAADFTSEFTSGAVRFIDEPEVLEATHNGAITSFDTTGSSVYGVIYSVDSQYVGNILTFDYSMQDGDTLSLRELLLALNVVSEDKAAEFMQGIASVKLSDPSLMAAIKIDEDVTAGRLKDVLDITTQYSAQLNSDNLEVMDSKKYLAGDWALISLKAFDTAETISVAMANGDLIKISVTDDRAYSNVLYADGATYRIVVNYDESAGIPDGAQLNVREIERDTIEYNKYLSDTASTLLVDNSDVSNARFFDLEITYEGEKIEPEAPVQVSIEYANAIHLDQGEAISVVHFADDGAEVISSIEMSDNQKELTYEQDSFSVTGTIISNVPRNGRDMVLVKYPDSNAQGGYSYYIVNNDASLTKVDYNPSNGTFETDYPMLWYFDNNTSPNRHIYYNSEGTGYDSTMRSSDFFRRYLDPNATGATTQETTEASSDGNVHVELENRPGGSGWWRNDEGIWVWDNRVTPASRSNAESQTTLFVEGATDTDGQSICYISNAGQTSYLGVQTNAAGEPTHLVGGQQSGDRATFVIAEARSVNGVGARYHTVDHIDISVEGASSVDLPLARGTYYYVDDTNGTIPGPGGHMYSTWEVTSDVTLPLDASDVSITPEDMKHATIEVVDKNHNVLNNAFVITGYSANTTAPNDTPQVRIEGSFKVANLDPVSQDQANADWVRSARLNNRIYYIISDTKPVTFKFKDDTHGQLYEMTSNGLQELSVTIDVGLSASFDFFDEKNTCPGIRQFGNVNFWRSGGIEHDGVGMDFRLGGDASGKTDIVAIEIMKRVVDQNGNLINPSESYAQSFDVYVSNENNHGTAGTDSCLNVIPTATGSNVPYYREPYPNYGMYNKLHDKEVIVGNDGIGLVFDYAVKPGMYYIEETIADSDDVPTQIEDQSGTLWQYVETRIETEYVWRYDGMSGRHISDIYSDRTSPYRSIPEVLGAYTGMHTAGHPDDPNADYTSPVWYGTDREDESSPYETKDWPYFNGFLEFYVYNVYTTYGDFEISKKVTGEGADPNKLFTFTIELTAPDGLTLASSYNATLNGTATTAAAVTPTAYEKDDQGQDILDRVTAGTITIQLKADDVYDIQGLPTGTEYKITEADYTADGYTTSIPSGVSGTIEYGTTAQNQVEVTNAYSKVDINVIKINEETREETTPTKLDGAEFELYKIDDHGSPVAYPDASSNKKTTVGGSLTFENLTNGKYKIVETKAPDGYVFSAMELYFTVTSNSTVTWTESDFTTEITTPQPLVSYTNKTFTVGNPPGQPLPHTGGNGTILYTLCGIAMIAAAGYYGLASRRRARKEVV